MMSIKRFLIVLITAALLLTPITWGPLIFPTEAPITDLESNVWLEGQTLHVVYTSVDSEDFAFNLERLIKENDVKILDLHLDNGGGNGLIMFDIIDTIERLKVERGLSVITHARGCIASAAVPLFLMGDTRVTYKNTFFMVHPCGGWNHPMLDDCQRFVIAELTIRYCKYVEDKTNMDFMWCWNIMAPEDLEKNSQTNQYWFNADEALMMGFATELR